MCGIRCIPLEFYIPTVSTWGSYWLIHTHSPNNRNTVQQRVLNSCLWQVQASTKLPGCILHKLRTLLRVFTFFCGHSTNIHVQEQTIARRGGGWLRITDDIEPSITITGMCPAAERQNSQYTHSRGSNIPQETSWHPRCPDLRLSNPSRWVNFGNRLTV
jgi:hypothetical protein